MEMYCKKCGDFVDNNQNYCSSCGSKIVRQNTKRKRDYTILLIAFVFVLLMGSITAMEIISRNTLSVQKTLDPILLTIRLSDSDSDYSENLKYYFWGGDVGYSNETLQEIFYGKYNISFSCKVLDQRIEGDVCYADVELRADVDGRLVKREVDNIVFFLREDGNLWLLKGTYILDELGKLISECQ